MNAVVRRLSGSVAMLALAVWAGGLLTLGAVVAPLVFRYVPAPFAATAMTSVFGRFDRVALGSAAVALVAECVLWARDYRWGARARGAATLVAAALASVEAFWLGPGIQALHFGGAVRGLGESGQALDRLHRVAEGVAKGELLLLATAFFLHAWALTDSPPPDTSARETS